MEKTVCELFAGVGGFRLGLEAADPSWKTVWMNQWEPSRKRQDAYDCYCAHFGHKKEYVNEDIASIDKKTIPDHTLLVGGFPCQDSTTSSKRSRLRSSSSRTSTVSSNPPPDSVEGILASSSRPSGHSATASNGASSTPLSMALRPAAGAPSSSRTARIPHTAKKSSPQKTVSLGTASLPRHSRSKKALL